MTLLHLPAFVGGSRNRATADAWIAAWEAQVAQDDLERGAAYWEPLWVTLLPWIGGAGVLIGLAWLVWLSRPNPERGEVDWRYRDF